MISLALSIALLSPARATPPARRLDAGERIRAVMIVVTPRDAVSSTPTTEFLARAADVFERRTRVAIASAEQAGFDGSRLLRCPRETRLGCWVQEVRPEGTARGSRAPDLLLALTILPLSSTEDRLSAMLIDTARAFEAHERADRAHPDWRVLVEDEIDRELARSAPVVVETGDRAALAAYFTRLIEADFASMLGRRGDLEPLGRIDVVSPLGGGEIDLDGAALGGIEPGATTIEGVRPGKRYIALTVAEARESISVLVEPGRTATASFSLAGASASNASSAGGRAARLGLLAGSAGAAVIGSTLIILSAARASSVEPTCLVRRADESAGASCAAIGFPSTAFDSAGLPTFDRDTVDPGGVPLAPIGAGLIAAALAWSAGALLWIDDDGAGLLPTLAVGLGAGGAGLAVSLAVNPR